MDNSGKTFDLIVVGAGAFGLSTALHLLRRGIDPATFLLLDSQPFPSTDAASNDTSRVVRVDYSDPFYVELAKRAIEVWKSDPVFKPH
jgi:sarcosine oxidase / L-pipecolate oxidase